MVRLEASLAEVTSVRADMVQEKRLEVFDDVVVSTGVMTLRLPEATRWEYTAPIRSIMVMKGSRARLWHESTGKTESFRLDSDPTMKRITEQISGWLRADLASLKTSYDIEALTTSPLRLRLTPQEREVREFVTAVEVEFARNLRHMRQLTIHEKGGDWTRLTFRNVRVNAKIADEVFEIRPDRERRTR